MDNISKCFGEYCNRKVNCHRYTAKSNKVQIFDDYEKDCKLHNYRNYIPKEKKKGCEL